MSSKKNVYTLGEFKDDQIQNITASFVPSVPNLIDSASGAFVPINKGNRKIPAESGNSYNTYKSFNLDASQVARTGTTTHGKQLGVNYIIKF